METVTSCIKIKDWQNKEGKLVPIYGIGLSDGQSGESFGKEIPIGTPMGELIIESGQYGNKIKLKSAQGSGSWSGGGGKSRGGNESFALSYSKDLVVAGKVDLSKILATADKFYTWLESKKPVAAPAPAPVAQAPRQATPPPPVHQAPPPTVTDDLPF